MAQHTTFEPVHTIEPIYTGGAVNLSQDGQVLATCVSEDLLLTHLATGRRLAKIEGDGEALTTVSLTLSCSHVITCSRSLSMRIYALDRSDPDLISVQLLRNIKPHSSPVITLQVDDTGSLVATGAADGVVKIWDVRGGYTTHTLHGHTGIISALKFFKVRDRQEKEPGPDNKSKKRRRAEVDNQEPKSEDVGGISHYRLASGDDSGAIRIWHLQKRKCLEILDAHASVVRSLDFDEKSQLLLSGSRDCTAMLWDASSWELKKTIPVLEEVESTGFVSLQENLIYTGGQQGALRLWWTSGSEATETQKPGNEGQSIVHVIFNPSLSVFLSVHADQNLVVHSFAKLNEHSPSKNLPLTIDRRISGTHDEVIDLAYVGRQGHHLAVATNLEAVKIISLHTPEADDKPNRDGSEYFGSDSGLLQGHEDIVICIDVDWSGHWLATGAKDNTARLWCIDPSSNTFSCYATFTGHAESLGAIALPKQEPKKDSPAHLSPFDHPPPFLLTGSQDKTIKRWDIHKEESNGRERPHRAAYTRKAHDRDINALDINSTSTLFLSASQDRVVKIWSLEEGEVIGVLRGHKRGVWSAKYSPKNTASITAGNEANAGAQSSSSRGYVVTSSGDKTVKIWSVSDFSCLRTFEGHTNSVLKVLWMDYAPNNSHSTSQQKNGDNEANAEQKPTNHKNATVQVASAGSDGLVKIWDVNSGECACTLDNHTDRVWALALNPRSTAPSNSTDSQPEFGSKYHNLVSGSADSTITLWRDTTQETTQLATEASNARIEQDQALQNYIRNRSYKPAILLALKLNHPARLLSLFTEVTKTWPKEKDTLTGVGEVDDVLRQLSDQQLLKLLQRLREWNANARTANVAQVVLWALLKVHPAGRFTALASRRDALKAKIALDDDNDGEAGNGSLAARRKANLDVKDILDTLRVYTERHYKRMEDIVDESFLVEYTLREMDEITGTAAPSSAIEPDRENMSNGANGVVKVNGVHAESHEEDVIMV